MAKPKGRVRAILLAAGKGTRMHSTLPKILHPIAGRPMVQYALEAVAGVSNEPPVLVVGHGAELIQEGIDQGVEYAHQEEQLGTGHAVLQAKDKLKGQADLIVVSNADMPLLSTATLQGLVEAQAVNEGPLTMLTVKQKDPRGFGRVQRSPDGRRVLAIVEEAEASEEQLANDELNVGAYCFRAEWLWPALEKLTPARSKGEYYLTDLIELAVADGLTVGAEELKDRDESIGVNTREHLAQAEAAMRARINRRLMLSGVTIIDPPSTYIEAGIQIGQDSLIHPNCHIQGETVIGQHNVIGPNAVIRHSRIGDHCRVDASYIEHAVLDNHVEIGPFSHLRKGAHLQDGVHLGNYAELKNSTLGPGAKMGHFSYLGDASVGANANIGAGTITANYDGTHKNKTEIGDDAFIGVDTMLVAPLKIGKGARTGAGAVVTKDVPPRTLVVGIPARAIRKLEGND